MTSNRVKLTRSEEARKQAPGEPVVLLRPMVSNEAETQAGVEKAERVPRTGTAQSVQRARERLRERAYFFLRS